MAEGTRDPLSLGGPSTASLGELLCAQLCIFWVPVQSPQRDMAAVVGQAAVHEVRIIYFQFTS